MDYILGSGICGYGASLFFKDKGRAYKVYAQLSKKKKHIRLQSKWRDNPVISNTGLYGLSRYYHGVSPISILSDPLTLKLLKIDERMPCPNKDKYYVVLRKPIRPKFGKINDIAKFDTRVLSNSSVNLCQSVIGNLLYLNSRFNLRDIDISDDIVFKAGDILHADFNKYFDKIVIKGGGYHLLPMIKIPNGMVTLRPVFNHPVDLNFIDLHKNFFNISPGEAIEKLRSVFFLRKGVLLGKVTKWECHVQLNIPKCYLLNKSGEIIEKYNKNNFSKDVKNIAPYILNIFPTFKLNIGRVGSGIHLGYDREVLDTLPENIKVFDTSLNDNAGADHPTIVSFLNTYRILNESK
jgi:hypothetical protein